MGGLRKSGSSLIFTPLKWFLKIRKLLGEVLYNSTVHKMPTLVLPRNVEFSNKHFNIGSLKGTGTRDLIWLKVVSLERS